MENKKYFKTQWLSCLANRVIKGSGSIIFAVLLFFSMRWTFYNHLDGNETMLVQRDSMIGNLLWAALFFSVVICIMQATKGNQEKAAIGNRMVFAAAFLWITGCCIWWIGSCDRPPLYDAAEIRWGVERFVQGDYIAFQPGQYFQMYPNQLGLAFIMEALYSLFGKEEYLIFQIVCGLFAVGIFVIGYALTGMLVGEREKNGTQILYSLLMCGCLPLFFYTTWVYGEIPFLFFSFLAFGFLLKYGKVHKWGFLAGMVICSACAVIVRGNAWIVVVALLLVLLVQMISQKDWKLAGVMILLVALPYLCLSLITMRYENRTKLDLSEGMPSTAWIAMGMGESPWAPGWYNDFCVESYWETGFDKSETAVLADARIKERFQELVSNPAYAVSFYKDKVVSQWEDPLYQSLFFNTQFGEEKPREDSLLAYLCSEAGQEGVRNFSDRWQFFIYLGTLGYFLFAVKKEDEIRNHTFGAALIGYFLFSILWEGKARYIFPCYVMMFPLAAVGISRMYLASVPYLARLRFRSGASEKERFEGGTIKRK